MLKFNPTLYLFHPSPTNLPPSLPSKTTLTLLLDAHQLSLHHPTTSSLLTQMSSPQPLIAQFFRVLPNSRHTLPFSFRIPLQFQSPIQFTGRLANSICCPAGLNLPHADETNAYGHRIHTMPCQNKVQNYQFKY